jgi:hypothetical protein
MKEEDLNKIAAVENAIAKKYGKEAIKNPRADWSDEKEQEYLEQLKKEAITERNKKTKVEKVDIESILDSAELFSEGSERTCPVCKVYSFSIKDDVYLSKYDCCFKCYIKHVEGREEAWQEKRKAILGESKE